MADIAISSKVGRVFRAVSKFWAFDPRNRRIRADLAATTQMCNALSGHNTTVEDIVRYHEHYLNTAITPDNYGPHPSGVWSIENGHSIIERRLHRVAMATSEKLVDRITAHISSPEFTQQCLLSLRSLIANEPVPVDNVFATDAHVVFEIVSGPVTDHDCIHFLLPRLMLVTREGVSIVQAPYWVYCAFALLAANSAPNNFRDPRDSQLRVGAVWLSPSPEILDAALRLWDPLDSVVYKSFGAALAAAAALA